MYISSFNHTKNIPEKMPPELEYSEICVKALKLIHKYKEIQYKVHVIDWAAIESVFKLAMTDGFNLPVDSKVVMVCIERIYNILSEIRALFCRQPGSARLDELEQGVKGLQSDIITFSRHYVEHFKVMAQPNDHVQNRAAR
jgi:hypothetical protein